MIYRCWWYNHIHYGTSYQHRCSRCRVPRCVLGSWWSSWARPGSQLIFRWSRISWVMLSLIGWICMDLYGFSQHILRHSLSMFELSHHLADVPCCAKVGSGKSPLCCKASWEKSAALALLPCVAGLETKGHKGPGRGRAGPDVTGWETVGVFHSLNYHNLGIYMDYYGFMNIYDGLVGMIWLSWRNEDG